MQKLFSMPIVYSAFKVISTYFQSDEDENEDRLEQFHCTAVILI